MTLLIGLLVADLARLAFWTAVAGAAVVGAALALAFLLAVHFAWWLTTGRYGR